MNYFDIQHYYIGDTVFFRDNETRLLQGKITGYADQETYFVTHTRRNDFPEKTPGAMLARQHSVRVSDIMGTSLKEAMLKGLKQ